MQEPMIPVLRRFDAEGRRRLASVMLIKKERER
jgi:hypothetical protein